MDHSLHYVLALFPYTFGGNDILPIYFPLFFPPVKIFNVLTYWARGRAWCHTLRSWPKMESRVWCLLSQPGAPHVLATGFAIILRMNNLGDSQVLAIANEASINIFLEFCMDISFLCSWVISRSRKPGSYAVCRFNSSLILNCWSLRRDILLFYFYFFCINRIFFMISFYPFCWLTS